MLTETNNLENLNDINVQALKRVLNMLSKKDIVDENNEMSESDKLKITSYRNLNELWSLYKLSQNKHTSFREMILGF